MKATELFESGDFRAVLIHETTPENAEKIRAQGFKPSYTGIFFNTSKTGYSGGGYGGAFIECEISGPAAGILDLESDDNLPDDFDDDMDGEEIASYARARKYWAWKDNLQIAVLNVNHIRIIK